MENRKVLKWDDIAMAKLSLEKMIMHFAHCNRAEGLMEKTIGWYGEMLGYYIKFLKSLDKETVLDEFNIYNVRDFIVYEQGRNLSPFTVQCKVRASFVSRYRFDT